MGEIAFGEGAARIHAEIHVAREGEDRRAGVVGGERLLEVLVPLMVEFGQALGNRHQLGDLGRRLLRHHVDEFLSFVEHARLGMLLGGELRLVVE